MTNLTQTPVAYGANGRFVYTILSGTQVCNNTVFGDPSPGILKACYILSFPHVADEGQSFDLGGGDFFTVLYGSARNGNFFFGAMKAGNCNNATFGDPDPGPLKHCYGEAGFVK